MTGKDKMVSDLTQDSVLSTQDFDAHMDTDCPGYAHPDSHLALYTMSLAPLSGLGTQHAGLLSARCPNGQGVASRPSKSARSGHHVDDPPLKK